MTEDHRAYNLGNESAGVVPAYALQNGELIWPSPGLTKRELFAMAAMQGLAGVYADGGSDFSDCVAKLAVSHADSLLRELAK